MLIGEQTAERIKIEIGWRSRCRKRWTWRSKGRDLVRGIPRTLRGPVRRDPGEALQEPWARSSTRCEWSLERTPPELAADIVDRGIYMTGGGGACCGLDLLMREVTNLNIRVVTGTRFRVSFAAPARSSRTPRSTKVILSGHRD